MQFNIQLRCAVKVCIHQGDEGIKFFLQKNQFNELQIAANQ